MYTPELFYRPIRQGQVCKPAAAQTTTVPSSTSTKPSKPTIPVEQPKMPDLLPLKSMISSSPPVSVSSSSSSSNTKTKSKLRLVRPWEQRKREEGYKDIEVVNVDEDYDEPEEPEEPEEAEEQQDTEQEYVLCMPAICMQQEPEQFRSRLETLSGGEVEIFNRTYKCYVALRIHSSKRNIFIKPFSP